MLTLVHIADLHLGAEYSFLPEEKAAVCREAQFQLLERVIDHSGDISAEVILIPGDLFDSPTPSAPVASRAFALLGKARCPVLISPGAAGQRVCFPVQPPYALFFAYGYGDLGGGVHICECVYPV